MSMIWKRFGVWLVAGLLLSALEAGCVPVDPGQFVWPEETATPGDDDPTGTVPPGDDDATVSTPPGDDDTGTATPGDDDTPTPTVPPTPTATPIPTATPLPTIAPDADGDGSPDGLDCDDANVSVYPGAAEACNEQDDNCNGSVDELAGPAWFQDADGDSFGSSSVSTQACTVPLGFVEQAGDCDDTQSSVYPGAEEVCDGVDTDCDPATFEADYVLYYADMDVDGYGNPEETLGACSPRPDYVTNGADCDDGDAAAYPGALEVCDGRDQSCDGQIDEGVTQTFYWDGDQDGWGSGLEVQVACSAPPGYVAQAGDCEDALVDIHPGAAEVCDGIDTDCDGLIDDGLPSTWYLDADADGFGDGDMVLEGCAAPLDYVAVAGDCDDLAAEIFPGQIEVCNGIDDDCSGTADDVLDGDGDGKNVCAGDCDDTDPLTYPGAFEPACNGIDHNCDGVTPPPCRSCAEVLSAGASSGSGVYTIDVDGSGGEASVKVYCDMTTDGGGFTLVQRTVWTWTDQSSQLFTGFDDWSGKTLGNPSPNKAFRLKGKLWSKLDSTAQHLFTLSIRRNDGSTCDPLHYRGSGLTFNVDGDSAWVSGDGGGFMPFCDDELSTRDSGPVRSTVEGYLMVPWFLSNSCGFYPTLDGDVWTDGLPHPSIHWYWITYFDELDENAPYDVCGTNSVAYAKGYYGLNVMEYYLR